MIKKILIIFAFACSGLCGFILSWYMNRPLNHPLQTNEVLLIETYHHPVTFVNQLTGDPQTGRKIFQEFCATCHAKRPIINIEAPRIGDKKSWQNLKRLGFDTLLKVTIKGAGAMPARGGCFECSDEQLKQAIEYILKKSQ